MSANDPECGDEQPPGGWQQVTTLGLVEVVMTVLCARKAAPSATAAAVSRERYGNRFHVQVSLLNEPDPENNGHSVVVVADFRADFLGQDLDNAFEGKDVIVLK
jgi:hypothetical protein